MSKNNNDLFVDCFNALTDLIHHDIFEVQIKSDNKFLKTPPSFKQLELDIKNIYNKYLYNYKKGKRSPLDINEIKERLEISLGKFYNSFEDDIKIWPVEDKIKIAKNIYISLGKELIKFDDLQKQYSKPEDIKFTLFFKNILSDIVQFFKNVSQSKDEKIKKLKEKELIFASVKEMKGNTKILHLEAQISKCKTTKEDPTIHLIELFNIAPEKAINELIHIDPVSMAKLKIGNFDNPHRLFKSEIIIAKLLKADGIDKAKVGEYLKPFIDEEYLKPPVKHFASKIPSRVKVYLETFDFEGKSLVASLRMVAPLLNLSDDLSKQMVVGKMIAEQYFNTNKKRLGSLTKNDIETLISGILSSLDSPIHKGTKPDVNRFIKHYEDKGITGVPGLYPKKMLISICEEFTAQGGIGLKEVKGINKPKM